MEKFIKKNKYSLLLILILVFALALRLINISWGIDKDLPGHSYYPDEPSGYASALQIKPLSGELDPGDWSLIKGPLQFEIVGTVNEILDKTSIKKIMFPGVNESKNNYHYYTYLISRFITVILALLTIALIYFFCDLLFENKTIGLLAAFNYSIFAHTIPFSTLITGDILTSLLSFTTIYYCISAYKNKKNIGNDDAFYSNDLEIFFQKFYLYEKL